MTGDIDENDAKRSFNDFYTRETPHSYLQEMSRLGYQIAEQARPYCVSAANLLRERNPGWPIRMLDIGCSYGIGSAFIKYGCTFEELASFFRSRAPSDYASCISAMRSWLNVAPPNIDMGVVGLDVSERALEFAAGSGLVDCGIARDLENEDLAEDELAWIRGCNLLVCTGAIGYVGKPTFERVLRHLGSGRGDETGPAAVMTVLRMFDPSDVMSAFEEAGLQMEKVPGVRLPQRAFADEDEKRDVLAVLRDKGIDPEGWESLGVYYADLYVASRPDLIDGLVATMSRTDEEPPLFTSHVSVATARSG